MDFATAIAKSKSGHNALSAFKNLELVARRLPPANELDPTEENPLNKEEKVFKRMASTILRLADSSWWASAPKMANADEVLCELMNLVNEGYRIDILSSPFEEESVNGKLEWCKNNLPGFLFTKFHIRSDKETFANYKTVLIDDRAKVCEKFSKAGGCAVLFDKNWLMSLRQVLKNNTITTIYCDLDGVLVDTRSHIIEALKSL